MFDITSKMVKFPASSASYTLFFTFGNKVPSNHDIEEVLSLFKVQSPSNTAALKIDQAMLHHVLQLFVKQIENSLSNNRSPFEPEILIVAFEVCIRTLLSMS